MPFAPWGRNKMSLPGRTVIGIAGSPASGKTTLAEAVVQNLNRESDESDVPTAALVPMDGYDCSVGTRSKSSLRAVQSSRLATEVPLVKS